MRRLCPAPGRLSTETWTATEAGGGVPRRGRGGRRMAGAASKAGLSCGRREGGGRGRGGAGRRGGAGAAPGSEDGRAARGAWTVAMGRSRPPQRGRARTSKPQRPTSKNVPVTSYPGTSGERLVPRTDTRRALAAPGRGLRPSCAHEEVRARGAATASPTACAIRPGAACAGRGRGRRRRCCPAWRQAGRCRPRRGPRGGGGPPRG